ncbi:MAG: BolA family transcriptional regulator [Magnetospirillum sp.]|nr:BolA family transcriptional regulator [Magnetospirillum sp.]
MSIRAAIETKLTQALAPTRLAVFDESDRHVGHPGWDPKGETHFCVDIVSPAFAGKSRIERHRMVHTLLDAELKGGVHALALSVKAPGEE